ncbi:MAG TPA: hypothetical protein VLC98_12575 [Phnomibacter sp.]|nr:hypothetical protein [Phnomibacter sp.]
MRLPLKYVFLISIHWLIAGAAFGQAPPPDARHFFEYENVLQVTLQTDYYDLRKQRQSDDCRKATISFANDTTSINHVAVEVKPRGVFRRAMCNPPQLMVNFKTDKASPLYKLGRLKLVTACSADPMSDQLVIKEYLVYKMLQVMTGLSFRVRLVQVDMLSLDGTRYSDKRYAFFLEDVDDVAERNNCVELAGTAKLNTEALDRESNTMTAIFQFMIGNTDWSIPQQHNIKIVQRKEPKYSAPFSIPYDFDGSGMVNAPYALPSDDLPIQSVTDRLYRGYGRTYEELEKTLQIFRAKKPELLGVIQDCAELNKRNKKEMTDYLNSFFEIIDNKFKVKEYFIANARTQ